MEHIPKTNAKNTFVYVCIAQTICIAVILISALIIKLFFKSVWQDTQYWCINNFLEKTKVSNVFDEDYIR